MAADTGIAARSASHCQAVASRNSFLGETQAVSYSLVELETCHRAQESR